MAGRARPLHAGVKIIQDVLSNSLPDSFFPGAMPFSNKDGYTIQVLASVQVSTANSRQIGLKLVMQADFRQCYGASSCLAVCRLSEQPMAGIWPNLSLIRCCCTVIAHASAPSLQGSSAVWRPQWMEFPELVVRADVVVRGQRLDEALVQLAVLLTDDLRELDAVPVFFVQGLRLVKPLGKLAGAAAPTVGTLSQRGAMKRHASLHAAIGAVAVWARFSMQSSHAMTAACRHTMWV